MSGTWLFLKTGSFLAMKEKKRELQNEKFEIQARYNVLNAQELKIKIKKAKEKKGIKISILIKKKT